MRRVILSTCIAFSVGLNVSGQALESPRVNALRMSVEKGSPDLETFWREVADKGAPLVEREGEHRGYALVTFVWRGDANTRRVIVDGQLGQLTGTRRADNALTQLVGTSMWYRSYWLRDDLRTIYRFQVEDRRSPENGVRPLADPFAPPWPPAAPSGSAPFRSEWSILEMPRAVPQPWLAPGPNVARGNAAQRTWTSPLLKNERSIWIYTPPDYRRQKQQLPLLVMTDGAAYLGSIQAIATLDSLIAARRIPPVIAVFVGNAPIRLSGDGRLPRSIELSCNPMFVEFLADELIPWVRSNYDVTTSASQTIIGGYSLGGVNAAFAALRRPDTFGNVLSQSGAFWWRPPGDMESEWLTRQIGTAAPARIKFYLDVGLLEAESNDGAPLGWEGMPDQPIPYGPSILLANRHLRDVLRIKGYDVQYAEFSGGHNALGWRGTFANGLIALLGFPQ